MEAAGSLDSRLGLAAHRQHRTVGVAYDFIGDCPRQMRSCSGRSRVGTPITMGSAWYSIQETVAGKAQAHQVFRFAAIFRLGEAVLSAGSAYPLPLFPGAGKARARRNAATSRELDYVKRMLILPRKVSLLWNRKKRRHLQQETSSLHQENRSVPLSCAACEVR
jgi:hypothetical protein